MLEIIILIAFMSFVILPCINPSRYTYWRAWRVNNAAALLSLIVIGFAALFIISVVSNYGGCPSIADYLIEMWG